MLFVLVNFMLLLFATTRFVIKSVKVPVVEVDERANFFLLDSTIDPQVTSQSGVCCKRTGVSHIVVKLHILYRCRLVHLTPYAVS